MNRDPRSKRSLKRLNPRQRKKLRVGEYQEFVFQVRTWFHQCIAGTTYDQFLDAFIEMIEARNLCVGGMGGQLPLLQTDGMIATAGRGSPSAEDQTAVLAWLQKRAEVTKAELGDLVDAWHGW